MHQKLNEKLSVLNSITEKVLSGLSSHDPEILQKKPSEAEWSIVQVLDHLISSERASLGYVRKKIKGIDQVRNVGFNQRFLMNLSKLVYAGHFRFKAPVSTIAHPANEDSLEELRRKWMDQREDLRAFLEEYPDQYLQKAIYRHPFLGRISLSQMMEFFHDHIRHHQSQIKRILSRI